MGIAGLARRLDPYASRYTSEELGGYHAIVDGPSLAYHAHDLALAHSSQDCPPSYTEINAQAIRWLKALESVNIKVSAILFDGTLPNLKRDERLSRLGKNNQRVRQFRIDFPAGPCPIPTRLGSILHPLLAPSLREALGATEYASVTRIVPGEADDYCALCANENPRSVIFSNDTDLVLYDYPAEGRVIFYRDVELWPEPKFKGYSTIKIQQALHLTSLVPFAYCITQDPWKSFGDSVKDARQFDITESQYRDFSKRYSGTCVDLQSQVPKDPLLVQALQTLDVRVSEFVHQALEKSPVAKVYLPLIVEDPNQASAWSVGEDIRLLAYSLIAPDLPVVHEYKRKAQAIATQEVKILSSEETCSTAATLSLDIDAWLHWTVERQVPRQFIWPLIALNIALPALAMPPKLTSVVRLLSGSFDNTWDFIHLTARIQAALYSFRFFEQCAVVWLATHQDSTEILHRSVEALHRGLQNMPPIADLFIVPGQAEKYRVDSAMLQSMVKEVYASANIDVPDEQISNKKLKKQRREAERKTRKKQVTNSQRTDNLFELLNQRQKG